VKDKETISKGPKKRDSASVQTLHAILIPAGTILRQEPGKPGVFSCPVGYGVFTLDTAAAVAHPEDFKRVIAA
jgi:hypothetical protein